MVARRLNELISEHLLGGPTPFFSRSTAAAFHRPLLVLFDRNDDLITALHHTSTYQVRVCVCLRARRANRSNLATNQMD